MTFADDARFAATIAEEAGRLLLQIRAEGMAEPGWDGKALGKAGDLRSNELLLARLAAERPGDAVLSEESVDDPIRLEADRVWIIDPLDGTREYGLAGRDDWAVHVALWARGHGIAAAAVAQPSLGTVYVSGTTDRSHDPVPAVARILRSDSRPPEFLDEFCAEVQTLMRELARGVEPIHLERARNQLTVRSLRSMEQPFRRVEEACLDLLFCGRVRPRKESLARLRRVSAARVAEGFAVMLRAPVAAAVTGRLPRRARERIGEILHG